VALPRALLRDAGAVSGAVEMLGDADLGALELHPAPTTLRTARRNGRLRNDTTLIYPDSVGTVRDAKGLSGFATRSTDARRHAR